MIHRNNPIYEKDRWAANRSRTFIAAVLVINAILFMIAIVAFANTIEYIDADGRRDYSSMLQMYLAMAMAECMLVVLIMPAFAGISLSQEREKGNLELYFASGVTPGQFIFGKLLSCMNMLAVLLITSLPVFSLVFVYGGIQLRDLFGIMLVLMMTGLVVTSLSLFCASRVKGAVPAVLSSYCAAALMFCGTFLIHIAPSLLYQVSYKEQLGSPIGWYHYLLLLNPAITFYGILNNQAGSREAIFDLINYQGNYRQNWLTVNWLPVSIVIQLLISALFIAGAIRGIRRKN